MNYQETVSWIFEKLPMFHRIGAPAYKADLKNTHMLMQMTGNPHQGLVCIHIAGTNGKGSVSHMLASVLQEAGYKTGLYTSPHLFDYRERMRVNGKMIPKKYIAEFIGKHKKHIEQIEPSFFEITVALAFSWFRHEKVDVAVIETGMGGRLDSTNIITPVLSVITNIGLDHTMFLGNTVEKIAAEKAGIIKPEVPVVIGETQDKTISVFKHFAVENGSLLKRADKELFFLRNHAVSDHLCGHVLEKGIHYIKNICCPLPGNYQEKNILTVIESARVLKKSGFHLKKKHISAGIKKVVRNTSLMGRWDVVSKSPKVICDVAHNIEGLDRVFRQLNSMVFKKLHIILGVNNDKNLDELFQILPINAEYYFCKANVPRALETAELTKFAKEKGFDCSEYSTVTEAFVAALSKADPQNDVVFAGGSTFVVAEIPLLKKKYSDHDD
jgi:dihydrofolate synthase / folylpolyglutamate synthase